MVPVLQTDFRGRHKCNREGGGGGDDCDFMRRLNCKILLAKLNCDGFALLGLAFCPAWSQTHQALYVCHAFENITTKIIILIAKKKNFYILLTPNYNNTFLNLTCLKLLKECLFFKVRILALKFMKYVC